MGLAPQQQYYSKVVPIEAGRHFVWESSTLFQNSAKTGLFSGSLWDDRAQNSLTSSICCWEQAYNVKAICVPLKKRRKKITWNKKIFIKKKKIPDYGTDMQTWEYRT